MSEITTKTDSALIDSIVNCWKSYKNLQDWPHAGEYYNYEIAQGIFNNTIIKIPLNHLPLVVCYELDKLDNNITQYIFYRAVKAIFQNKYGYTLTRKAVKENRIKIMLI